MTRIVLSAFLAIITAGCVKATYESTGQGWLFVALMAAMTLMVGYGSLRRLFKGEVF